MNKSNYRDHYVIMEFLKSFSEEINEKIESGDYISHNYESEYKKGENKHMFIIDRFLFCYCKTSEDIDIELFFHIDKQRRDYPSSYIHTFDEHYPDFKTMDIINKLNNLEPNFYEVNLDPIRYINSCNRKRKIKNILD